MRPNAEMIARIAFALAMGLGMQVFFEGWWHSKNNYHVPEGSYRIYTISASDYKALTSVQQSLYHPADNDGERYMALSVDNGFVFGQMLAPLVMASTMSVAIMAFAFKNRRTDKPVGEA